MNLYLAGPMSGIPNSNHPAFHAAAKKLRAEGHKVMSPAEEYPNPKKFVRRTGFFDYCRFICAVADGVALLPGWEYSPGAKAEHALAVALRLKIIYLEAK